MKIRDMEGVINRLKRSNDDKEPDTVGAFFDNVKQGDSFLEKLKSHNLKDNPTQFDDLFGNLDTFGKLSESNAFKHPDSTQQSHGPSFDKLLESNAFNHPDSTQQPHWPPFGKLSESNGFKHPDSTQDSNWPIPDDYLEKITSARDGLHKLLESNTFKHPDSTHQPRWPFPDDYLEKLASSKDFNTHDNDHSASNWHDDAFKSMQKNHFNVPDYIPNSKWSDPYEANFNNKDFNSDFDFKVPEIRLDRNDYTYDLNYHHRDRPGANILLGFVSVILVGVVIYILIYTVFKFCLKNRNDPSNTNNNAPLNRQPANPTNTNTSTPTQAVDESTEFDRPLISATNRISNRHLDLPPTYADSTNNSTTNPEHNEYGANPKILNDNAALPTYEEALANIDASAPPCEIVIPSAPPCTNNGATGGSCS